jgi:hypothetical protein
VRQQKEPYSATVIEAKKLRGDCNSTSKPNNPNNPDNASNSNHPNNPKTLITLITLMTLVTNDPKATKLQGRLPQQGRIGLRAGQYFLAENVRFAVIRMLLGLPWRLAESVLESICASQCPVFVHNKLKY